MVGRDFLKQSGIKGVEMRGYPFILPESLGSEDAFREFLAKLRFLFIGGVIEIISIGHPDVLIGVDLIEFF